MSLTMRQNAFAAAPLAIALLTAGGALIATPACSSVNGGKVAQTVLDVGNAVCEALSANDVGGDKVQIVCKYVDQADNVAHVFIATVPAAQAAQMGIRTPATMALMRATAASNTCAPAASSAAPPPAAPK